jgi:hypothetical protein
MRFVASIASFLLLVLFSTAASSQIDAECERFGLSAAEGARLRIAGMSQDDVRRELAKTYSEREAGMGVTAAFTYLDLREFAMSDFVSNYCKIVNAKDGKLTDFDKLWIRTHYDRAVECAKNDQVEKRQFLECWNEQHKKAKEKSSSRK